ncbi:MAG: hypothetical protein OXG19_09665 [Chloroflexi bacterium]|nr:hypothetical protein [Chloroflexota bacterium]
MTLPDQQPLTPCACGSHNGPHAWDCSEPATGPCGHCHNCGYCDGTSSDLCRIAVRTWREEEPIS